MPTITVTLEYEVSSPTLFGACPNKTGSKNDALSDALRVVTKYGAPAVIRQFLTNFGPPNTHADFSTVHTSVSNDLNVAGINSGQFDGPIAAMAEATPANHVIEVIHELDSKVRKGKVDRLAGIQAKNRFHDIVKATKPSVLTCNTLTAWLFEGEDPTEYNGIRADLFGLDCDGINPSSLPYPSYTKELAQVPAFVDTNGYSGWSVPEFGAARIPSDTDGSARAAWMLNYAQRFRDAGAAYVALYDYESTPGIELTTAAELDAWRSLI